MSLLSQMGMFGLMGLKSVLGQNDQTNTSNSAPIIPTWAIPVTGVGLLLACLAFERYHRRRQRLQLVQPHAPENLESGTYQPPNPSRGPGLANSN